VENVRSFLLFCAHERQPHDRPDKFAKIKENREPMKTYAHALRMGAASTPTFGTNLGIRNPHSPLPRILHVESAGWGTAPGWTCALSGSVSRDDAAQHKATL
jgi:hypothetical protein